MKVVNRMIKAIILMFYYLFVDIQLYFASMLLVSPILLAVVTIYNLTKYELPILMSNKLWLLWIIVAFPVAVCLIVKTYIDIAKPKKKSK